VNADDRGAKPALDRSDEQACCGAARSEGYHDRVWLRDRCWRTASAISAAASMYRRIGDIRNHRRHEVVAALPRAGQARGTPAYEARGRARARPPDLP